MGGEADPKAFFYKPPWSQRELNETQDWNFTLNEANFNSQTVAGKSGQLTKISTIFKIGAVNTDMRAIKILPPPK